jgi:TRAP-type transport system periplasmic protein
MALLMDMPMLFRDLDHWNKVLDGDALQAIAADVADQADVMLIGYGGGGTRNLIVNRPVETLEQAKGLPIRVMGEPIQAKVFEAFTMAPTVIAYTEIYNAIQTGVIDAAENEAAGIERMKFYEVGPHIVKTGHVITVRPLCFSGKTFRGLPQDLQAAILKAGREACSPPTSSRTARSCSSWPDRSWRAMPRSSARSRSTRRSRPSSRGFWRHDDSPPAF